MFNHLHNLRKSCIRLLQRRAKNLSFTTPTRVCSIKYMPAGLANGVQTLTTGSYTLTRRGESGNCGKRMAKQIMPVGVVSLVMWAACGAAGQNPAQSLPDAPSARTVVEAANSSSPMTEGRTLRSASMQYADVVRERDFSALPQADTSRQNSRTIFEKYLRLSPSGRRSSAPDSDGGLMSRATQAASRIFVTRDDSGKGRLNTSYFLRTLTAVAASTASRPYYRRSLSEPFNNFGSTIGNDAGMNVLHEFEPGIQHLMKSHAPKFAARLAERIGRN